MNFDFGQLPPELNAYIQSYNRVKIPENVAELIQKNVNNTKYLNKNIHDMQVMLRRTVTYGYTFEITQYLNVYTDSILTSQTIDKILWKNDGCIGLLWKYRHSWRDNTTLVLEYNV